MEVLKRISDAGLVCKTGIMVGIGETDEEILQMLADIREKADTEIITIGQYLQPSKRHLPLKEFVTPEQFKKYETLGLEMGFIWSSMPIC